jgi:hypothetical protein
MQKRVSGPLFLCPVFLYQVFEAVAPVFEVVKLVVAGSSRRQQTNGPLAGVFEDERKCISKIPGKKDLFSLHFGALKFP